MRVVVVVITRMVEVVLDESFNRLKHSRDGIWRLGTGSTLEPPVIGLSLNQKTCPLKAGLLRGLTCSACI